jgi:hypothetical protein
VLRVSHDFNRVFSIESVKLCQLCGVKSLQGVDLHTCRQVNAMQCARVRARLTYAYKALRSQPVDFTTASRFFSWAVAVPALHQMQRLAAKVHHFTEESRENHHFLAQSVYLLHMD